jgi:hypothetical protein
MPLVHAAAKQHAVPAALILGVIQVESSFRPAVCSHAGACGLMQLMPRTAASLARQLKWEDHDVSDPAFNIEAGTAYLAWLNRYFKGDLTLALAGYNAGPMRVRRWQRAGRALPRQVALYASKVMAARDRFAQQLEAGTPVLEPPKSLARQEEQSLDRGGLRDLIKKKEQRYGPRPDVPLPSSTMQAPLTPPTPAADAPEEAEGG